MLGMKFHYKHTKTSQDNVYVIRYLQSIIETENGWRPPSRRTDRTHRFPNLHPTAVGEWGVAVCVRLRVCVCVRWQQQNSRILFMNS